MNRSSGMFPSVALCDDADKNVAGLDRGSPRRSGLTTSTIGTRTYRWANTKSEIAAFWELELAGLPQLFSATRKLLFR